MGIGRTGIRLPQHCRVRHSSNLLANFARMPFDTTIPVRLLCENVMQFRPATVMPLRQS
jgi:hypothetical protein